MANLKELVSIKCPHCGCFFGMPQGLYDVAQKNEEVLFYCPYGHDLHFPKKKEAKKDQKDNIVFFDDYYKMKRKKNETG